MYLSQAGNNLKMQAIIIGAEVCKASRSYLRPVEMRTEMRIFL
jgi:hypothetical protein